METHQLIAQIEVLPEQARITIEQPAVLLERQCFPAKMLPTMRAATPLIDAEK